MTVWKRLYPFTARWSIEIARCICMLTLVKFAVAAALLSYVVWYLEPASLWQAAGQINGGQWLVCGIMSLLGIAVQWLKWQRLVRIKLPELSWSDGLYSLLGGSALGFMTPGRLGEVGRGIFLGRERASLLVLAAVDKLSSVVVTTVLGGIAAWILWPSCRIWLAVSLFPVGIVLRWAWRRWNTRIEGVLHRRDWGVVLGWSLLFNLLFMSQFYWLVRGNQGFNVVLILAIPAVFALKALLPVGFLDIGVREAAAVFVFTALHLEAQAAFVASVILFLTNVCLPAVLGGLWIIARKVTIEKHIQMIRKVAL